ncbi:DnaJ domainhypothetical protein zf-CSL following [Cryptosporidium ryanae]|uniref:DnaJ domainhypothetical protein zf-CSL following n=1 Tax=Cryptosporidium ryanae TaxID=515981 RepID=UPI00351A48EE|nr:DnaJ domainhypothetical protein zf-CSL following [Cryptosporidium ryanae]
MSLRDDEIFKNCTDYYTLLGLRKDATEREIRLAFLRQVRRYHPDKNVPEFKLECSNCDIGNQENKSSKRHEIIVKYHALYEAYSTLKDQTKRSEYDLSLFNKGISKKHSWHKVLDLNELEYYADEETFCYSCNCGELIVFHKKHIEEGFNLFPCDSCSTKITITL